jgi:hypothetical protein
MFGDGDEAEEVGKDDEVEAPLWRFGANENMQAARRQSRVQLVSRCVLLKRIVGVAAKMGKFLPNDEVRNLGLQADLLHTVHMVTSGGQLRMQDRFLAHH